MIDRTTHTITEFALPNRDFGPFDIVTGPDGNLWLTIPSFNETDAIDEIIQFNPNSKDSQTIPSPTGTTPAASPPQVAHSVPTRVQKRSSITVTYNEPLSPASAGSLGTLPRLR